MKRFSRLLVAAGVFTVMTGVAAAQDAADKYLNEAHAHKSMANTYIGNPNHPMDANMANHCNQMAKLALANAERAKVNGVVNQTVVPAAPAPVRIGRTPSPSH